MSHSLLQIALQAAFKATELDEQAVSMLDAGPPNLKKRLTRPWQTVSFSGPNQ
jgi:hypothetical protein